MRSNILTWTFFLTRYNGTSYILGNEWKSSEVLQFFTNSVDDEGLGCGAYFNENVLFRLALFLEKNSNIERYKISST